MKAFPLVFAVVLACPCLVSGRNLKIDAESYNECPVVGSWPQGFCDSSYAVCDTPGARRVYLECPEGLTFNAMLGACDSLDNTPGCNAECKTALVTIRRNMAFGVLDAALEAANLTDALDDPDLLATVFMPTDSAFLNLAEHLGMSIEELLSSTELLRKVLLTHVVPEANIKFSVGNVLTTLNDDQTIRIETAGSGVRLQFKPEGGDAAMFSGDLFEMCSASGVPIETVLVPSNV